MIQKSTMNAMANARNRFQGDARRVLCVCSAGMLRSPTAANVLHNKFGFNTRAAGMSDFALIPVSEVLLEWADQIVCMNDDHKNQLLTEAKHLLLEKDVISLGIPDEFPYMDATLQQLIIDRYTTLMQ